MKLCQALVPGATPAQLQAVADAAAQEPAVATLPPPSDPSAQQEPQQGQGEDDSDQPSPQPVEIFPIEDRLEGGQIHAGMNVAVLRNGLVFLEFLLPGLLA